MSVPVEPITKSKHIFFGLYAHPKTGKTRFIGETKMRTLIIRPPTDHPNAIRWGNVRQAVVEDWAGIYDVQEQLRSGLWKKFDWVWLDSLSAFQSFGVDDIFEQEVKRFPHRMQYGADKGEYGRNMERLGRWIREIVAFDKFNFGFTAWPEHVKVNSEGDEKLGPWVQGKGMVPSVAGYMNVLGYMEVVESKGTRRRVIRFKETDDYIAGDQFDAFLPKGRLVDPTMDKFQAAVDAARGTSSTTSSTTKNRRRRRRREQ